MKKILHMILILAVVVLSSTTAFAEIKIGMLAQRGAKTALKEWGGLQKYLTAKLGEKVTVVPLKFTEFMDFCDNEPEGFIFTNPWFYVRAKVLKGARALVTVKYLKSSDRMCGVIFTRSDSGITSLTQLRNKKLMCPSFSSPGGWLFEKGEILKAGIKPERDLTKLLESKGQSHDDVVYAVRDKKVDVGTVRNNILETMQREGKINMQDFRILHQVQHPGMAEVCSTQLYPDWPVASLRKTPPELAEKLKQALLDLPPGDPALIQARGLERFEEALDYTPMEDLCRTLKVDPFRQLHF
jgi:ABC-type phosphate/phosphonate transport system substrate-binding protein